MRGTKPLEAILITGSPGSGKTTVAFEVSAILRMHEIEHGVIDTDELDRLYPTPLDQQELSKQNLQAVWQSFASRNCHRLILCGVMADLSSNLEWAEASLPPNTTIQVFWLEASTPIINERLMRREIGSLLDEHIVSSARAAKIIKGHKDSATRIGTDNVSVTDIARQILNRTGWL